MQTQAILELHLLPPLASIAHDYLRPISADSYLTGISGHGELCAQMSNWNTGLEGICFGGHIALFDQILKHIPHFCKYFGIHLNRPLEEACKGGHLALVELIIS